MATLQEYFESDFSNCIRAHQDIEIQEGWQNEPEPVKYKLKYFFILDFILNVKSGSVYMDSAPRTISTILEILKFSLHEISTCSPPKHIILPAAASKAGLQVQVKKIGDHSDIICGFPTDEKTHFKDLLFNHRLYLYINFNLAAENIDQLSEWAKNNKISLFIRDLKYRDLRSKFDQPKAFISHDSRDKDNIARPMAECFRRWLSPVWYDEYSLNPGDSLRESIEKGIKSCQKCIIVLTKNYLSNPGWTKTEFNAIFTKELIEKSNSIIPVWCDVTKEEIYDYCPILVDRVGIKWDIGAEEVCRRIHKTLV